MATAEVIQNTSGSGSSYTFSSIPSSYNNLYLVGTVRSTHSASAGTQVKMQMKVNSATSGYVWRYFYTDSTSPTGGANWAASIVDLDLRIPHSGWVALQYNQFEMWIPNYSSSDQYKNIIYRSGNLGNSSSSNEYSLMLNSVMWESTSAINTLYFAPDNGNFDSYTNMTLYGLNGYS